MTMKILYLVTTGDMGGAQKYVLNLAQYFHGSIGIGQDNKALQAEAKGKNLPVYTISHLHRNIRPKADFLALCEVYQLLKKLQPDILHVNSSKAGVLGSLAGWLARVPVVFTAHGFQYLEPMSSPKKWLFWACERFCRIFRKFVITVSNKDRMQALFDGVVVEEKSTTIHHGIATPNFLPSEEARNRLSVSQNKIIIGTIANAYYTKGLDVLIDAVSKLRTKNVECVIIGDGPNTLELKKQAHSLGVEANIKFVGQLANASNYLQAFNVFVLPSRKEGFPYALLEALTAGLPIVATNVGGNKELLNDAGLMVLPENSTQLAEAIDKLLNNKELAEECSTKAKLRAKNFTTEDMLKKTSAIYEVVLEKTH